MANRPKRPHTVHLNGTFLPQQSLWWFSFTYSAILGAAIGGQPTEPHEPQLPLCPCWYSAPLSYAKRNEFFQYNWNFNNLKGPVLVGAQDFFLLLYYKICKWQTYKKRYSSTPAFYLIRVSRYVLWGENWKSLTNIKVALALFALFHFSDFLALLTRSSHTVLNSTHSANTFLSRVGNTLICCS